MSYIPKDWVWSPEQGDYWRAIRRRDGSIERYEWGRQAIEQAQSQQQQPPHVPASPPTSTYSTYTSAPPPARGGNYSSGNSGYPTHTTAPSNAQPYQYPPSHGKHDQPYPTPAPSSHNDAYGRPIPATQVEAYGRPIHTPQLDAYGRPIQRPQVDAYGRPIRSPPIDAYGRPIQAPPVDAYGRPINTPQTDEYGRTVQSPPTDEYGHPLSTTSQKYAPDKQAPSSSDQGEFSQKRSRKAPLNPHEDPSVQSVSHRSYPYGTKDPNLKHTKEGDPNDSGSDRASPPPNPKSSYRY